ncbi:flagellar basal body-associated protein FliL [Shewanella sp. Choline-02u-19]|jgi:flagellar FliL protein|uniref:flagellar basal body-associated protein FliL n=1 Tax=Shewanella TaxID=22 RepID=UPI000C343CE9|nr:MULTISPECIES: flagellar basal body-associated protein FliL [Shewanella]MCL1056410.1 flagellar basal body-associated protein FliL [Shewanella gelidimarina]PKG55124.1 flagellar basal body-associated protein FliL [Shewanella sp. GutDb-MelDb]PKG72915.1 flagellar basal body-associated protein FliL [Shewanella sp. GutCb]PKH58237.1 flagellar basal body-associated protein FliL [Shewanella sp. Bg11-22]PKI29500.1 flagellar basal body-associated protein FliL [Shewanella sp. Choline-02u-19]
MKTIIAILLLGLSSFSLFAANDKPLEEYAYYGFEPEIVTNYISNRNKLGYVRLSVELMVKNPEDLVSLERHDPLLRAAIVEILGNQTEDKVKSLTGKEEIRRECYEMVNRLLEQETGKDLVVNLLFTKYLYD